MLVMIGPVATYFLAKRTRAWVLMLLAGPFISLGVVVVAGVVWSALFANSDLSSEGLTWATLLLRYYGSGLPLANDADSILTQITMDGLIAAAVGIGAVGLAYLRVRKDAKMA